LAAIPHGESIKARAGDMTCPGGCLSVVGVFVEGVNGFYDILMREFG